MFWKIFDIACTSYKILTNACKILHALQNDSSSEILSEEFDALCKEIMNFLCNIEKVTQNFVITFNKQLFQSQETVWWF